MLSSNLCVILSETSQMGQQQVLLILKIWQHVLSGLETLVDIGRLSILTAVL